MGMYRRIAVIGCSGSGKSTMAKALELRGRARLELDALHHGPDWEQRPTDEVRERVSTFLATHDQWVIDGNYAPLRDLIWPAADTIVWLDPPRHRVLRQITWRTLRRTLTREELWNGNREPFSNLTSWDPERSIIAWSMTTMNRYRAEYFALMARGEPAGARWIRVRSRAEADAFLASIA